MANKSKMTSGDRFLIAMLLSAVITLAVGLSSYLTGFKMPTWLLFVIGIVVLAFLFYAGYQFIGVIYDACTLLYKKVRKKPITSTIQGGNETSAIELPVIEQKVTEAPKILIETLDNEDLAHTETTSSETVTLENESVEVEADIPKSSTSSSPEVMSSSEKEETDTLREGFYNLFVTADYQDKPVYEVLKDYMIAHGHMIDVVKVLCCAAEETGNMGWLKCVPTLSKAKYFFGVSLVGDHSGNYSTTKKEYTRNREEHLEEIRMIKKDLKDRLKAKTKSNHNDDDSIADSMN